MAFLQEAKIQEEKLEKWMACVPGYDSHWAFSQVKKGYSGESHGANIPNSVLSSK